jgi:ABC-type amino acid transport substrate-binding protein
MKHSTRPVALSALLLAATLAACTTQMMQIDPPAMSDTAFGDAVRAARLAQTINPQASRNNDPVTGIDGQSARGAIDAYHAGFKEPPRSFGVLGIGNGAVSGVSP